MTQLNLVLLFKQYEMKMALMPPTVDLDAFISCKLNMSHLHFPVCVLSVMSIKQQYS